MIEETKLLWKAYVALKSIPAPLGMADVIREMEGHFRETTGLTTDELRRQAMLDIEQEKFVKPRFSSASIIALIEAHRGTYGRDALVWYDAQGNEHRHLDDADKIVRVHPPVRWGNETKLPHA